MGFPRQEHWSGLSFPPPGDLTDPGIEPGFPTLQADSLPFEPPKNHIYWKKKKIMCKWNHSVQTHVVQG